MPIFLLQLIVGVVLSVASTLLEQAFGPKKTDDTAASGTQESLQVGGTVPAYFVIGTWGLQGKLEYVNTWGASGNTLNAYRTSVISFGDLPITALVSLFEAGQSMTLTGSGHTTQGYPVAERQNAGSDRFWEEFFDGTQTTANSFLTGKFGADPTRPWLSDMIGRGIPYATITALWDRQIWTADPDCMFGVQGIKLYDPRLDTTAGGSGSQRLNDQTTWAFTDNLAVMVYNVLVGIRYQNAIVWGGRVAQTQLPYANWAAAMNACDTVISIVAGGSEKQFRGGRVIQFSERPADVITEFLIASNARIAECAGTYTILVGAPGSADGAFTDADTIITEAANLDPFPNIDNTINGATEKHLAPELGWTQSNGSTYYRSDLEATDRGQRLADVLDLTGTVFSGTQAQRILKATVEEGRRFLKHAVPMMPQFGTYRPLNCLAWTSTENQYSAKLFLVTAWTEESNGNVILGYQEIDASDHSWTPAADEKALNFAPLTPVVPGNQVLTGWTAFPADFVDGTGTARRPGIGVTWDSGQVDVKSVYVEAIEKVSGKHEWSGDIDFAKFPAGGTLPHVFLAATVYQVRGDYIPYSGRSHTPSSWLDVTTNDVRLTSTDIGGDLKALVDEVTSWGDVPGDITAEALARAAADAAEATARASAITAEATARDTAVTAEATQRIADGAAAALNLRDLQETVMRASLQIADQILTTQLVQRQLLTHVAVREGAITAAYTSSITVALGPGSAVAEQFSSLTAQTASLLASIQSVQTAYALADTNEAAARQALQIQVTGGYAGSDPAALTTGLLYSLQQAQVAGDSALSTAISLVAAGSAILFDWLYNWSFDVDVQSWTGNGTPTESGGYLRPANDGSDPYVTSPTGLGVASASYKQVKSYIRKTGAPTWEGYAWYKRTGDSTWDSSRRSSIAEPTYDGSGRAVVTWEMAWDGTIDQIRIDLSAAADVSNYFEFDWIDIGRPSPGASQAQVGAVQTALTSSLLAEASSRQALSTLLTGAADPTGLTLGTVTSGLIYDEKTSRVSGDSSLNTSIAGVQSNLDVATGNISALSAAQSALSSSVSTLSGTVTSLGSSVTSLTASVAGKASTTVTDNLQAEVDAIGTGDAIQQMAQTVRAIQLSVTRLAVQTADGILTGQRQQQYVSGSLASVSQSLTGQISSTNGNLTLLGQQVALINLAIPNLATLALTNSLDGRVTATETSLTVQGSAITSINTTLAGKADSSALTALTSRVTAAEGSIVTTNSNLTSLTTTVGTKASASALTALDTRVTTAEGTIASQGTTQTSQGSAITSLQNALTGYTGSGAVASALSSLNTTVTSQGTTLTAQATSLSTLFAALGSDSAQINVKFEAQAAPAGFSARYAVRAAVDADGVLRAGTMFIDVPASTGGKSRIGFEADQTVFFDSSGNAIALVDGSGIFQSANGKIWMDMIGGGVRFSA